MEVLLLMAWSIFMLKLGVWHERRQQRKRAALPPTEKQIAYLEALAAREGVDIPEVGTRAEASAAIDALKAGKS